MDRRRARSPLFVLACVLAVAAGRPATFATPAGVAAANVTRGCVDRYDPAKDYFPDKVALEDAVNFSVTYHRSYKLVEVRRGPASPATGKTGPAAAEKAGPATREKTGSETERYVLLQCGAPRPALDGALAGAQVAVVPVSSLFSASTTHLPLLVDLGRLDVLTGISTSRFLIGDEILRRTTSGRVREFAPASVIDTELVVAQRPGVFMAGGSTSAELSVIRQAGIPVVSNHEWLEPTALARAEWLKFMALFLNEERAGQRLHGETKARYTALSARARAVPEARKPTVMTGRGTRGDFVIAGGRSYVAALIADAGGRYVWADNTATGSQTLDLEAQLGRARDADIWINGGGWSSRAAMVEDEPRYGLFKAYRTGQVWVYERRLSPAGANDYWSRAVSHPDLVLADLVKIFHPDLAREHAFQWYLQVPTR